MGERPGSLLAAREHDGIRGRRAPPVVISRAEAAALDAADPLRHLRYRYVAPDGIYLAANSLGPMPRAAAAAVTTELATGWSTSAVSGWHERGWWELPERVGARLARLLGAAPDEVVCGDSTSVQLHQALGALIGANPGRRVVAVDAGDFPGDGYVAASVAAAAGLRVERVDPHRWVPSDEVAVAAFSAVSYATGARADLLDVTTRAHRVGALICWDLSHAAGAVPVDLSAVGADAAVGCTYKYLCGGPGAPGYLYLPRRLQDRLTLPIRGWHGHADPFALEPAFRPAPGIARARIGTPPVLSMVAAGAALDVWDDIDIHAARKRSVELTTMVIELADAWLSAHGVEVVSPRQVDRRGSHVALRHERGFELTRALAEGGVIADFRAPDLIRIGVGPLTTLRTDVWDALDRLRAVLEDGRWRDRRFAPDGRTVT